MKQIHSFDELRQIKDTKVYALGTFDGIHRGHQRVIRKAVEEAASVNGWCRWAAVTLPPS